MAYFSPISYFPQTKVYFYDPPLFEFLNQFTLVCMQVGTNLNDRLSNRRGRIILLQGLLAGWPRRIGRGGQTVANICARERRAGGGVTLPYVCRATLILRRPALRPRGHEPHRHLITHCDTIPTDSTLQLHHILQILTYHKEHFMLWDVFFIGKNTPALVKDKKLFIVPILDCMVQSAT